MSTTARSFVVHESDTGAERLIKVGGRVNLNELLAAYGGMNTQTLQDLQDKANKGSSSTSYHGRATNAGSS